jgi:ABC-type multidrug transport system fused ATPase/permease subunit
VILIAHRLSTVERADRILGIDAGDLVEDGTPDELHHQDGLFAMLQRHQFGS